MPTTDSYLDRIKNTAKTLVSSRAGEGARLGTAPTLQTVSTSAPPITSVSSGTNAPTSTQVPNQQPQTQSPYDALLQRLQNQPAYQSSPYPDFTGPSMSAAQRAALAVNGKYSTQAAALRNQQAKADQNLQVGQDTQRNYGVIGDAKLKEIYGNLTGIAQGTADKTAAMYKDAQGQVDSQYQTAANTQAGLNQSTNEGISNEAASLGLSSAVAGATADLHSFQTGAQAQMATDRANSVSNIITLGANMGAAALKDVNIMAQLGADSRRDLVSSVQNTLSTLQYQHDQVTSDLQTSLASLEAERASALQAAQFQYEADDADKLFQYQHQKATYEAQQQQYKIGLEHQNLSDMLSVLKAQSEDTNSQFSRSLAQGSADLQQQEFASKQLQNDRQYGIDAGKLGISAAAQQASQDNTKADNARQDLIAKANLDHQQNQDRINSTKYATDAEHQAAMDKESTRWHNQTIAIQQQDAATRATTAAAKITADADKAKADAAKAAEIKRVDDARIAKLAADTKAIQAKNATLTGSLSIKGFKGESGLDAWGAKNKMSPQELDGIRATFAKYKSPAQGTDEYKALLLGNDPYLSAQASLTAANLPAATKTKYRAALQILAGK